MSSVSKGKKHRLLFCIPFPNKSKKPRVHQEILPDEKRLEDSPTTIGTAEADALAKEKAEVKRLEAEIEKLKGERDADAQVKVKLEDGNKKANELLEAREKEIGQMDAEIQRLEGEGSMIRAKLSELQAADARAQELSVKLAEKEKLLSERTTELSAAQVFLTKVDAVSEAEVVGMVDNLNTLICSACGALSEAWDQREPMPGAFDDESILEQIRNDFGDLMVEQIRARNSVAVNVAIQTCLGQFVRQVTSGWGSGQAAGDLAEIYGKISTKESQTIASRWRTLTKRYTPRRERPQSDETISGLARILVVTESFADISEAAEAVKSSAGTEIDAIIDAIVQLDDIVKTKVASSDMSVYVALPGTAFSEEIMDDEFAEGSTGGEAATVAGTMEIGLLQKSGDMEKMLRKPKVILERDLVEPEGEKSK